jgi:hypothetical protein
MNAISNLGLTPFANSKLKAVFKRIAYSKGLKIYKD